MLRALSFAVAMATVGCNALFGMNDLSYDGVPASGGRGGSAGAGGSGGATGGAGGMGDGGSGGAMGGGGGGGGLQGGPAYACDTDSLLLCMHFDDGLVDDGPLQQIFVGMPTYDDGVYGNAIVPDANATVIATSPMALAVTELTFAVWARSDGTMPGGNNDRRCLIDYEFKWGLYWYADGLRVFQPNPVITGVMPPTDSSWHHYAVTNDGSATRLFIDGVEVVAGPPGSLSNEPMSSAIAIGDDAPAGGAPWLGAIDEVRVWGVAQDAAFIAQLAAVR